MDELRSHIRLTQRELSAVSLSDVSTWTTRGNPTIVIPILDHSNARLRHHPLASISLDQDCDSLVRKLIRDVLARLLLDEVTTLVGDHLVTGGIGLDAEALFAGCEGWASVSVKFLEMGDRVITLVTRVLALAAGRDGAGDATTAAGAALFLVAAFVESFLAEGLELV